MTCADSARKDLFALTILGALAFAGLTLAFTWATDWTAPYPRDASHLVVGRDFLNLWTYGRAAFEPQPGRYYDPSVYNSALQDLLGADYPVQSWSYPPTLMAVAMPFGLLGYRAALAVWTGLGMLLLLWTGVRMLPRPALAFALFVSPAAVLCLLSGQSAFLTLAMLLAIFALLDKRPVLAGVLIGALTLKPQVGLLLPVMLIAARHWRAFASAAATAIALAAITAALYGWQIWRDYLALGVPSQNEVLRHTDILSTQLFPTVFMNLHLAGLGYGAAMAVQSGFTLAAGACVFWAFRTHAHADRTHLQALFFAASVSATPYLMPYDTLPLAYAAVALLAAGTLDGRGRALARLVWWLPFVQMALGHFHIPGAGFIAPVFTVWLTLQIAGFPSGVLRLGVPRFLKQH